ncbi:uncharacterized protein LOC116617745 isoform X2 [Nematostella vectensis]|uniref:uncharacterized protein LOC116617745 isoform X2 n=1 Tax=Nematostella vectensis TaxID=45351 RepID=UPI002076EC64|nr:uncharacterized protein LOC116617745 isoform X2 [Nematostella vectensis]
MSKENVAKEMEERMEKEIPFNPDNKMDPSVPDNVGATKNRAPDNEGAIKIPAPNNDGEMKDPALGDEGAMTNPAQDIEGAIKATALDTKGLLADDDGAKETPLAVNEGSTKSSVHEERAKEMDKEDDAAVVASIKAEIYRQQMKYALLTSANEELKRNVSRIEHDIENVVNTSEFRQQTVELFARVRSPRKKSRSSKISRLKMPKRSPSSPRRQPISQMQMRSCSRLGSRDRKKLRCCANSSKKRPRKSQADGRDSRPAFASSSYRYLRPYSLLLIFYSLLLIFYSQIRTIQY